MSEFVVLHGLGGTPEQWDGFVTFEEALWFRDEYYPGFPIYQLIKEETLYRLPDGSVIRDGKEDSDE